MTIVDSHAHAGLNWFEPVEMLLHQMNFNRVDKAVLIQHGLPETGGFDHGYLFECVQRFCGRFAVVVIVDHAKRDALETLEAHARSGAVGVRLTPLMRYRSDDPLAIWRRAQELGMVVSLMGQLSDFASDPLRELVAQFPHVPIVLEHLAGGGEDALFPFNGKGPEPPYEIFKKAMKLAEFENVYIKVHGLAELANRPTSLQLNYGYDFFDSVPPLVEMALQAFGPQRMMWGSDYPPVSSREGYRNAHQGMMAHPAFGSEDLEWVMGKTASGVFKF